MTRKSPNNFWICERGEAQYLAWLEWLLSSDLWEKKTFRPRALTVPSEWPPETEREVGSVLAHFASVREMAAKDKGCPAMRPVPTYARPWTRWTPQQQAKRVADAYDEANPPELPARDMAHVERLLERAGLLPWYRKKYIPPAAPKREPTKAEIAELASRESALASERKRALESRLPHNQERE